MNNAAAFRSSARRFLREPLVHFLLIGALIFAVYGRTGQVDAPAARSVIEIAPALLDRLSQQYAAVWSHVPNAAEMETIKQEYIREEVLYREAMALGLDRDDAVIRQRLRQKMDFLGEGIARNVAADDATLREWYAANIARFTPPPGLTFAQIFLAAPDDADAVLQALSDGADPAGLGRSSMLPAAMVEASPISVDGRFGEGFHDILAALPEGVWQGPITSSFGSHIVRVDAHRDVAPLPYEEVNDLVRDAWQRETADQMREAQYQILRSRYEVIDLSAENAE